jgi:L-asparagine transporter-like permease
MTEPVRKFLFRLFMLGLILTCLGYGFFNFVLPESYFSFFPALPVFLFIVTGVAHLYLVRASKGDNQKFVTKYLGAMGLKIFLYLVFILVFLAMDTSDPIPFIVSFLIMYVAFTVFEVISILNTLKNNS